MTVLNRDVKPLLQFVAVPRENGKDRENQNEGNAPGLRPTVMTEFARSWHGARPPLRMVRG